MNTESARPRLWDVFLRRVSEARFLTFSLLLHLVIVGVAGSLVLIKHIDGVPDFEAGNDGVLLEPGDDAKLPGDAPEPVPQVQLTAPTIPVSAPPDALVTLSQISNWSATVQKRPNVAMPDLAKSGLASLGEKMTASGAGAAMGRMGGTRSAMIFGRSIMANRLGVILDVSGSAHPHLAGAVTEIQRGFADAILILYPGCGLTKPEAKSGHQIRRFASLTAKDLEPGAGFFSTAGQLNEALRISEFEQMTKRPSVKETLFVSWYTGEGPGGKLEGTSEKLIGQTQVAFDELLKRRVDTIYWFSDFLDDVDAKVAERLISQMKTSRVKLHLHNFASRRVNPIVLEMSVKTGGSSNTDGAK